MLPRSGRADHIDDDFDFLAAFEADEKRRRPRQQRHQLHQREGPVEEVITDEWDPLAAALEEIMDGADVAELLEEEVELNQEDQEDAEDEPAADAAGDDGEERSDNPRAAPADEGGSRPVDLGIYDKGNWKFLSKTTGLPVGVIHPIGAYTLKATCQACTLNAARVNRDE